ncbi:hypothetical protein Mhun_1913 [Methanospirillum hungatei JF-1]|jgi:hypothetical protein|uniref:Uncharacterized protein n=1 Tax=Methanospirillum hungatei JF-1 (strain ATCC 27890 / DSM 864 / NBRC 100397 / JF-1) TaxID=323259 RepID=Q2FMD8_METHJ|nr:hypothetical protein [Methanospirillum hungatei]ABD41624.1 hypothetical protein Mhun_1913 [Methanospirillum hungatei JF-1]
MPARDVILDEIDEPGMDDQEYLISVVQSRIRDRKRNALALRAKEALSNVASGNVQSGGFKELWTDLND